ncbi:MAG TPA: hypothetical protein VE476_00885 [Propionibacteriaceae bacterium]|nr:hypothetical protein [Propionibacteriaceae bacterium]
MFNSRALQRRHGTEEENEYAAHDAVRAAGRGHDAGAAPDGREAKW